MSLSAKAKTHSEFFFQTFHFSNELSFQALWPNPRRIFTFRLHWSSCFLEEFDETINTSRAKLDVSSHARKLGSFHQQKFLPQKRCFLPLGQMTYEVWLVLTRPLKTLMFIDKKSVKSPRIFFFHRYEVLLSSFFFRSYKWTGLVIW